MTFNARICLFCCSVQHFNPIVYIGRSPIFFQEKSIGAYLTVCIDVKKIWAFFTAWNDSITLGTHVFTTILKNFEITDSKNSLIDVCNWRTIGCDKDINLLFLIFVNIVRILVNLDFVRIKPINSWVKLTIIRTIINLKILNNVDSFDNIWLSSFRYKHLPGTGCCYELTFIQ